MDYIKLEKEAVRVTVELYKAPSEQRGLRLQAELFKTPDVGDQQFVMGMVVANAFELLESITRKVPELKARLDEQMDRLLEGTDG
ncbi:hypothetical protein [Leifsonia aquatica]|uniref:hypothetical protein n=1 Tax=Leifsonia aquatica TaxID=144185 RepID=UPI0038255DD8